MTRPLVANMVGRNEADKYLHRVLKRLKKQVDLIVFTDDHSDDDTPSIAHDYGAHVFQMDEPMFHVHEGRLRQQSWDNLTSVLPSEDCFILAIDCDEELYETKHELNEIVNQDQYEVVNIQFFHMWNEKQFRIDKAWCPHPSSRMFRYHSGGRFLDRQLACGSEPGYVQQYIRIGNYWRDSGLIMKHLSYISDKDKKEKFDRYMSLDGGAFHSNAHILSIMDEDPQLADWTWFDE